MPPVRAAKATALAVCALSALAATAGCGQAQRVGRSRLVQVALTEYRLSPAALRVRRGPLTLVVHDFGRLAHNLAVLRGATTVAETPPIQPGSGVTLAVWLAPGTYTLASTLLDDEALGMHGKLAVTR